ncbi:protein LYRIC [Ascaphus truei]|uniref:protein LYRIC n=1 Tax=Ascaphus truei TaxID=8439 RepID=UPI003F59583A
MASTWQDAAAQQAEVMSVRLQQLLTTGLGLLRTELGVDLGLQPQRYPPWVFLAVPASLGLLLLLLLLCVAGRGSGKKRAKEEREPEAAPAPAKSVKTEEPKKKSKKKPVEKGKPNGRPVELSEEDVIPTVLKDNLKQPLDVEKKNEKTKKNKKKLKSDAKHSLSSKQDKKEAEDGNWETKISNREKRQQRKRDKGTDSDYNITGVETTAPVVGEQFTSVSSYSTSFRKTKGSSEFSAVNGSGWNEKPAKLLSSQLGEEKWATTTSASAGKKKAESCTWNPDAGNATGKEWSAPWSERPIFPSISAWSAVDGRMNAAEQRPSFSTIGLNNAVSASVSDPVSQPNAPDNQWNETPNEPEMDDEWSGLNGSSSAEVCSDWNAPAEEWGNWGEEEPAPVPQPEEPEQEAQVSDDDKEKEESAAQGSASSKTKKKKRKKKKQGEESGSPTQETENIDKDAGDEFQDGSTQAPPPPDTVIPIVVAKTEPKETEEEIRQQAVFTEPPVSVIPSLSEKAPSHVQQTQETSTSITKQNSVPPASQAKSEESWESPKQVKKKKKARRET